jgi:predicted nucleic acid-binding Zn ribbon protein
MTWIFECPDCDARVTLDPHALESPQTRCQSCGRAFKTSGLRAHGFIYSIGTEEEEE